MKQHTNSPLKSIASLALIAALSQTANANDYSTQNDSDGTYWGIGIGTVLGAVIAGPPGAAIGATLGGTYGWGSDKDDALEASIAHLKQTNQALQTSQMELQKNRSELRQEQQRVSELSRSNSEKSIQLANLNKENAPRLTNEEQSLLENLATHYQQEVFFKNGEKAVPDYAQDRLLQLSEFLKQHPNLEISLKGFADHRGPAEFNEQLAKSRAESVRDLLIDNGVEVQRIDVQSMGESTVLAQPGDTGNYILDRRVAIELSVSHSPSETVALNPATELATTEKSDAIETNDVSDTVLAEAAK